MINGGLINFFKLIFATNVGTRSVCIACASLLTSRPVKIFPKDAESVCTRNKSLSVSNGLVINTDESLL